MMQSMLRLSLWLVVVSALGCGVAAPRAKIMAPEEISETVVRIDPNNRLGSFFFNPTDYQLHVHIGRYFGPFVAKHGLVRVADTDVYQNEHFEMRIWATDHQYISFAFRPRGSEAWYQLPTYLHARIGPNRLAVWEEHGGQKAYPNLDELSAAFVRFYADIAVVHLNAPAQGDRSWIPNYQKAKNEGQ